MAQDVGKNPKGAERRIEEARRKISAMDLVCSGTLRKRKKTCGRSYCRCATDPEALHGPYYEWTRYEEGRLVHRTLSPEQAMELEKAIANYREIQALLCEWRRESTAIILGIPKRKSG
ncbi:MAG: hypothetical protein KKE79_01220 [Actinobacteria bacterium]|nr:hypothetical protein [Actinomycetota bacterium]MBU4240578.1 hypothetical protein [Actinomycetota bacterium]MBU4489233.1 hypothetical protein [Actinomycetota bacterium]MCG2795543.1 hypothetical protein [Actinomycetes bacterium]